MKTKVIALAIIATPFALLAQVTIMPVLDSTITCSYYKGRYEFSENAARARQILEVFAIVEEMPEPFTPTDDIEIILNNVILMNEQEKTFVETFILQCVVNCEGRAGDFQIIDCPAEVLNIAYQVSGVFQDKIRMWKPGKQNGSNVDVFIQIKVSLSEGKFSVDLPGLGLAAI